MGKMPSEGLQNCLRARGLRAVLEARGQFWGPEDSIFPIILSEKMVF